jgi:hypothetical protein
LLSPLSHYPIYSEEGLDEETLLDIYFKQTQMTWAKIFGNVSKASFDKSMKFLMSALMHDYRKLKEEEIE